ncbi:MAG: triphosphoribosyl-dephospho-CoA synthase [Candidatus Lokiarchaeota archaeon]|nr:triphosphoribosyl-dephospho-CoA synthase [Candidatus Lokiarchaeota archaeon]
MNQKTLITIALNSSLLEIRTWPKPGNVHKTQNFLKTTYTDFLTAIYNGKSVWNDLLQTLESSKDNTSTIYVKTLMKAVKQMRSVQSGGNVLLGHYLLNIPLFMGAFYCMKHEILDESQFWKYIHEIFNKSSSHDTIVLFNAIRLAQPGGMGTRKKYDLYNQNVESELIKDDINLLKIFELSKNYDTISEQLVSNYNFARTTIISILIKYQSEYPDMNTTFPRICLNQILQQDVIEISEDLNEYIVRVFLHILSQRIDTLIARKTSVSQAEQVSKKAKKIVDQFSRVARDDWFGLVLQFDSELQRFNGKLNPGTTADLLACSLFIYLIKQQLFNKNLVNSL